MLLKQEHKCYCFFHVQTQCSSKEAHICEGGFSMLHKDKMERINHLAQKAKNKGLTPKEKAEQHQLRQEYLNNIRKSFKNQFKTMTVIDPEGKDVTPQKVKDLQKRNKKQ